MEGELTPVEAEPRLHTLEAGGDTVVFVLLLGTQFHWRHPYSCQFLRALLRKAFGKINGMWMPELDCQDFNPVSTIYQLCDFAQVTSPRCALTSSS